MKLSDVANIVSGMSLGRIKSDEQNGSAFSVYNQHMFDHDLVREPHNEDNDSKVIYLSAPEKIVIVEEDDIVISMGSYQCTKVGRDSHSSILPYNFTYIDEVHETLDKLYLEYWFNHSKEAYDQFPKNDGRRIRKRLTLNDVRELEITLPDIETQRKIGEVYALKKELDVLYKERDNLTFKLFDLTFVSEGDYNGNN
ncbi:restriction endonuclease subunit S [Nosocomiicoccus sp. HMSC09A07]|uniref:restriction endonuclease subunit S n=1 Tax=Nosocomiicoccus sp. HMSC09A07 TaxID=1581145 RepID=UPI0008A24546|nr:restriction endonuclease subunit S [Nosocomiicoccus sp. HMSC09A07]OFS62288.1 hypothetical protein HMPREF3177_05970 [Nosocomiicoccus sp. HMSC09A07]